MTSISDPYHRLREAAFDRAYQVLYSAAVCSPTPIMVEAVIVEAGKIEAYFRTGVAPPLKAVGDDAGLAGDLSGLTRLAVDQAEALGWIEKAPPEGPETDGGCMSFVRDFLGFEAALNNTAAVVADAKPLRIGKFQGHAADSDAESVHLGFGSLKPFFDIHIPVSCACLSNSIVAEGREARTRFPAGRLSS